MLFASLANGTRGCRDAALLALGGCLALAHYSHAYFLNMLCSAQCQTWS